MILAGDIGGTSARLAYFELAAGRLELVRMQKYANHEYRGLDEILRALVAEHGLPIEHAAFGIAGPVHHGHVTTPNLPWTVEQSALAQALGIESVWLLNDLEANTYGIALLGAADFGPLNIGVAEARGNIAVISAGTGLGEAGAVWDGAGLRPFAGEGGHADFAARNASEAELLLYLGKRFSHVSWERVVSGPGLQNIYEFLRDSGRGTEQAWVRKRMQDGDPPAVIAEAAVSGRCLLSAQALDLFVSLYGAEAGNLALKVKATGGVYLGGGIAPKIIERLKTPTFMQAFTAKGRMRELVERIPVRVILNEDTALLGAARYAALCGGLPDPGLSQPQTPSQR